MRHRRTLLGLLAAGLLPALAFGLAQLNPQSLLDSAYRPALAQAPVIWTSPADKAALLRPASLPAAALRQPLVVGDRVMIQSRSGGTDAIEVVSIEVIDGASLGVEGVRFQVVTGHAAGAPTGETVRFLFAVDAPQAPVKSKPDRAL